LTGLTPPCAGQAWINMIVFPACAYPHLSACIAQAGADRCPKFLFSNFPAWRNLRPCRRDLRFASTSFKP